MTLEKAHIAVGIISTVISIVASLIVYAVTFGEMRSEVRHLKSKVAALEDKLTNSQVANDPTKVSVCDDLFGELRSSLSSVVRSDEEAIRAEIKKLDCYKVLPDSNERRSSLGPDRKEP